MSAEKILARNARIQLSVGLHQVRYFRPGREQIAEQAAKFSLMSDGGKYYLQVYDEREDSVVIARTMANIHTAEKAAKSLLDQKKVEAAKAESNEAWPEFLELNAAVYQDWETTTGGKQVQILILRDPEEVEEDGLLTTVTFDKDEFSSFAVRDTRGSWIRMITDSNEKRYRFLLVTVTSQKAPIVVFHREIKDGVVTMTDYLLGNDRRIIQRVGCIQEEVWLEGQPNAEVVAEELNAEEGFPVTEPVQKSAVAEATKSRAANGKTATKCPECGRTARVSPERLKLGKAQCNKCKATLIAA